MQAEAILWRGVVLNGNKNDLDICLRYFPLSADPFIEVHKLKYKIFYILRSEEFSNLESKDVFIRGEAIIDKINGIMALNKNYTKISVHSSVVFVKDQGLVNHNYIMAPSLEIRMGLIPLEQLLINGIQIPQNFSKDKHTIPQYLLSLSQKNQSLADTFSYFANIESWFDIYKIWEVIKSDYGGKSNFLKNTDIGENELSRFTNTVNSYRHHGIPLPEDPLTKSQAKDFIFKIFGIWINNKINKENIN